MVACSAAPTTTVAPAPTVAQATAVAPVAPASPTSAATTSAVEPTKSAVTVTKLNLNTVTGDQLLKTIPGFGNNMVREFLEYRPYVSIQQFRKEIGKYVSAQQVAEYEKYVYVPISVNNADAATLQQLPGVDAAKATALIAKRPFASNDAFLTELAKQISADELAVAKNYLAAK